MKAVEESAENSQEVHDGRLSVGIPPVVPLLSSWDILAIANGWRGDPNWMHSICLH